MGDLLGFAGRHLWASLTGALGVILLALGYADQAEQIVTTFEPWQLQATGAAFVVAFIVLVLVKVDKEHQQRGAPAAGASLTRSKYDHGKLNAQTKTTTPSFAGSVDIHGKTFLSEKLNPFALMDMCEGKTGVQAERIVAPYLGKWLRYSGAVSDVHVFPNSGTQVRFKTGDLRSIKAMFPGKSELADILHIGDKL